MNDVYADPLPDLHLAIPLRRTDDGDVRPMRPELLVAWLSAHGIAVTAIADGDGVLVTLNQVRTTDAECAPIFAIVSALRSTGLVVRTRRAGFARRLVGFRVFRPAAPTVTPG